ncbi:trimeric intracellular cation channel family protein [uncultured Friedmanniella sp.]|uniref:trimeric intracellular cation channel family protein n=1 Tax=uncultured Friedmanniella sp. TaxID=335381 RepID=UPI0035CC29B6
MTPQPPEALDALFRLIDLLGVLGNAVLGGALARRARLDLVGLGTLAILSGLGGGLIRDTLLQQGTPVALTDYAYIATALAGAGIAFLLEVEGRGWHRTYLVVDALALGCWAAAGAQKTLDAGLGWLPAVLLGAITAVGGGTVRDLVLGRRPGIFGGPLYATCALVASGVMVLLDQLGHPSAGLVATTATGAGLTLLARWRGWQLPEPPGWQPASVMRRYSASRRGRRGDRGRNDPVQ